MPDVHAKLSASGSAKWLSCPAALALEALVGEPDKGSSFATEGTAAHDLLEKCMVNNDEPQNFLGEKIKVENDVDGVVDVKFIEVTQEMVDAVEMCASYVDLLSARGSWYEERVDYSHVAPEGFGTADIIKEVYEKTSADIRTNKLYVIDFKYGAGIRVDAYENSQGMLYGLGALNTLDLLFEREIESVVVVIVQPRMDNISEYEISVKDLIKWGSDVVKPKAFKAHNLYSAALEEGESVLQMEDFGPTKKGCQWCQGKKLGKCKAFAQQGYAAAVEGFSDLTVEEKQDIAAVKVTSDNIKSVALLGNDELAAIYGSMSLFKTFAADVETEIRKRINAGEEVLGLSLEPTLKPRSWSLPPEEVEKRLRSAGLKKSDWFVTKLVTPTQAQARLKKLKPEDHLSLYATLEEVAITRLPGNEKIVQTYKKLPGKAGKK